MPHPKPQDEHLWDAYGSNPCDDTRNAILMHHWKWICAQTTLFLKAIGMGNLADSVQSAIAERMLRDAIPRYDSSRGTSFQSYVYMHIWGAAMDALVEMDPLPQGKRAAISRIARVRKAGSHRLGHLPTDAETAKSAGVGESDVIELWAISGARGAASDYGEHPKATMRVSARSREPDFDAFTRGLTQREKDILRLYYMEGYTMQETADRVGISLSLVSVGMANAKEFLQKYRNREDLMGDT